MARASELKTQADLHSQNLTFILILLGRWHTQQPIPAQVLHLLHVCFPKEQELLCQKWGGGRWVRRDTANSALFGRCDLQVLNTPGFSLSFT